MAQLPNPSIIKEEIDLDLDVCEKSLTDDDFRGELTNAINYCDTLLRGENLLTHSPPERISSVSKVMGEVICEEIMKILESRKIVTEYDLIMCDEIDKKKLYEECKSTGDGDEDEDYDPKEFAETSYDYIPLEMKARAVALAEAHPKWSLGLLQKRGCPRLTRKDELKRWKDDIKKGGTQYDKRAHINNETLERFKEARASREQVTNKSIQQWAMEAALPVVSERFTFTASKSWVKHFKRKHKIKQRKIVKYVSEEDCTTMEETVKAAERFQRQTKALIPQFDEDFVLNTYQTRCGYDRIYDKIIPENRCSEMVFVDDKKRKKVTHSYTAKYALTASGKVIPFVFLCMQEPSGNFDPVMKKNIDKLTAECKNVIVTCSKSGKLTTNLYRQYLADAILPYVKDKKFLLIIDSWGGQTNPALYDEIFENESGEATCTLKVIPMKCTLLCQPCDLYFYRQIKNLIERLQNAPLLQYQREIFSCEDSIKIHSLVLHQLSAPVFKPMIKFAWFASKLISERPTFSNAIDICFPLSLENEQCACQKAGFIKCSWCESILCFNCFFDFYHPKVCQLMEQDDG